MIHVCRPNTAVYWLEYKFLFVRSEVRILAIPRNFCLPQTTEASSGLVP